MKPPKTISAFTINDEWYYFAGEIPDKTIPVFIGNVTWKESSPDAPMQGQTSIDDYLTGPAQADTVV